MPIEAVNHVSHAKTAGKPVPHVIDLFCGIGGLSRGLMDGGFKVMAGYDLDGTCEYAYKALNEGAEFIRTDIAEVTAADILKRYPEGAAKVLVGCAPCQPFSSFTQRKATGKTTNGREDEWGMLDNFADLIVETSVDVASMENVTRLANREKYPVFDRFVRRLEAAQYTVKYIPVKH